MSFSDKTDCFTLPDGVKIPCVGYGTWQTPANGTTARCVKNALDVGYRHIDTAFAYGNESDVGEGLRLSGVSRNDIFLTTKHWVTERGYEKTVKAVETSLKLLGLDYIDLYLIHWPCVEKVSPDRKEINSDTWRGGVFGAGCSTYHRAPNYGLHCGALPNGKKKGETLLADSIGATPGCDKNGPTALLNSVLCGNRYLATSGNVLQMKFPKNQFGTETGMNAFIGLAKTYFRMGGQTLQINVVSKEELKDAKLHPEKHENLVVRVGGYSAYFTELPCPLQDSIITRTENMM